MNIENMCYNQKRDDNYVLKKRRGEGHWLFMVLRNEALFRIDDKDVPSPENSFVLFTPDQSFSYQANGRGFTEDWVEFVPDENEEQLIYDMDIPLNRIIPATDATDLSMIIRNLSYEFFSLNRNRLESIDLYFRLILSKLNEYASDFRRYSTGHEGLYIEKLMWLRESIYRWPAKEWKVDEMAGDISLSRSRLQHLYSETFGISISKDIITSRLNKATELLKKAENPISRIAAMVGYSNASYFNRQFRNRYGKTPSEYRKEIFGQSNT